MARKATINKSEKTYESALKMKKSRDEWKAVIIDPKASAEEKRNAQAKLVATRASSMVRVRRRCLVNGRGRGIYRRFGMCRNVIRKLMMDGMFPGGQKSSW